MKKERGRVVCKIPIEWQRKEQTKEEKNEKNEKNLKIIMHITYTLYKNVSSWIFGAASRIKSCFT